MAEQQECETASERESRNLNCTNCNKVMKEPKLLPCLHTFCKSPCLDELAAQDPKGKSLTCPTCEYKVILPEKGVAGLQRDLQAERLFEARKSRTCENDCETKATRYCCECEKFICRECTETHAKWAVFKDHEVLTTDDIKANPEKFLAYAQTPKCEDHNLEAGIYC